jgi:hypothetical protein
MASANTGPQAKRKALGYGAGANPNPIRRYPRLDLVRRAGAKRGWRTS